MLCNAMQVLKIISWYVLTWKNNFNIFLSKTKAYFSDIEGGSPKPQNLFIKSCVFILTCLNFSHLQSTLHLMQYTYLDVFSHCSKQFLNSMILMPFSAPAVFRFTSCTKWGNKKSLLG